MRLYNVQMEKVFALLPNDVLAKLAVDTSVNYNAKKLQGEVLFKLLLYCLLTTKQCSLRSAASTYESAIFGIINAGLDKGSIRYNSISERLSGINVDYFRQLYGYCVSKYRDTIGVVAAQRLLRFDSTIVSLSTKLLKIGYRLQGGDAGHLNQLKFTLGFSDIPEYIAFHHDQVYNSENIALREGILAHHAQSPSEAAIPRLFDRGVTARLTYDELSERDLRFVSRLNPGAKHTPLGVERISTPIESGNLRIESDMDVQLYKEGGAKAMHGVRLIKASVLVAATPRSKGKKGGRKSARSTHEAAETMIWFITNIPASVLNAAEVSAMYSKRWDIEVFFKFLKSHLNFSHLLSRSRNGILVMLYVTLIAAILTMAYRRLNEIKGFKMARQRFAQDLETELIRFIVVACGGDPDRLAKLRAPS